VDSEPVSISVSPGDSFQSAHSSGGQRSIQADGEAHIIRAREKCTTM
jgi:hypothetical protein